MRRNLKFLTWFDTDFAVQGEIVSHWDSDLGVRHYGEVLAQHGAIHEFHAIEEPHQELHQTVTAIVDQTQAGQDRRADTLYTTIGHLPEPMPA